MTARLRDEIVSAHAHAMSLRGSNRTLTTILQNSFEVERAIALMHQLQFDREVVRSESPAIAVSVRIVDSPKNHESLMAEGAMSKGQDSLQSLLSSASHPISESTAVRKSRQ